MCGKPVNTGELQDRVLWDWALVGPARFSPANWYLYQPALECSNSFVMESQYAGFPFQLITSENNVSGFCWLGVPDCFEKNVCAIHGKSASLSVLHIQEHNKILVGKQMSYELGSCWLTLEKPSCWDGRHCCHCAHSDQPAWSRCLSALCCVPIQIHLQS